MATVNLNHVQFWQPPKPSLHQQHTPPHKHSRAASVTTSRNQPVVVTQQRWHDFELQPEDEEVETQELAGRIHDPTNHGDDTDDTFPTIKKLLDPLLRKEIAGTGYQGTRDSPVILEEDESDSPYGTTDSEAFSTSVNAGPVPALERSQPADRDRWRDIEEGRFVYEDLYPLTPLDHEILASAPAQDQPPSCPYSLGEQTKPHGDNRTTRSASGESMAQSLPTSLDEDGGGENEENSSDLERDIQLAFEEQEDFLATSPSSLCRRSFESSQEKEGPREQEQEEMAADVIRHKIQEQELKEADNDNDRGKGEQRGGKRQHQHQEINNGIHYSKSSGHGYDTNDEEDENPRPTKQRRLFPASPDMLPTPPLEQSLLNQPYLAWPHSAMPSLTAQFETGNTEFQPDHAHPPTSVNNDHHCAPPSSPSPSDTVQSAPAADYEEWPFQGFLKRTTIGKQITYNLQFSLSHIPEHLSLSLHSEILSASSRELSMEAIVSRRAATSRNPGKELTENQEGRLAKMVHDDKTWAEIGGHFPGHTLQSLKDNYTKQGGKPRKRGRKPGVRVVSV